MSGSWVEELEVRVGCKAQQFSIVLLCLPSQNTEKTSQCYSNWFQLHVHEGFTRICKCRCCKIYEEHVEHASTPFLRSSKNVFEFFRVGTCVWVRACVNDTEEARMWASFTVNMQFVPPQKSSIFLRNSPWQLALLSWRGNKSRSWSLSKPRCDYRRTNAFVSPMENS